MAVNYKKVQAIVDTCPPQLRGQLADVIEHASALARQGFVPAGDGGNIGAFFAKQHPAIRQILLSVKEAADLPRDRPFADKMTPAQRFESFGFDAPTFDLINDAIDALDVLDRLGEPDRKTAADGPRDWVKNPPSLREHLSRAATMEEPKAHAMAHADREVAQAGAESRLPLRKHLEISSDIIGSNRDLVHDEPIIERGNNGDLRESVEQAIISVADAMP